MQRQKDEFDILIDTIQIQFNETSQNGIFYTESDLFDLFLEKIPLHRRNYYNCNACKKFINRYGGLVTIKSDGTLESVIWPSEINVEELQSAISALRNRVSNSKISGVFLAEEKTLGLCGNNDSKNNCYWTHFSVVLPKALVHAHMLKNASQLMAEKHEDFRLLVEALEEFPLDTLIAAKTISDQLYRMEKVTGILNWAIELQTKLKAFKGKQRTHLIWQATASAPTGFCHITNTVAGELLRNIKEGLSFEVIKKKHGNMLRPDQYQRPQALPSEGNIARAEAIVAQLESAGALQRRYAKLEDLVLFWKPSEIKTEKSQKGGVFSDLLPEKNTIKIPSQPPMTMTWVKFQNEILPTASTIEYYVPTKLNSFGALVTTQNIDAPPVLQWDSLEQRNPINWYVYANGSAAAEWSLRSGTYVKVNGMCYGPHMWYSDKFTHQGEMIFFILEGCKDTRSPGSALFPEVLKSEYREIRATIEAYSRKHRLVTDRDATPACGLKLVKGPDRDFWNQRFRITTKEGIVKEYILDRWD